MQRLYLFLLWFKMIRLSSNYILIMAFTDFPNVSNCFVESSCMPLAMAINVIKKDPKHYILCQQFILIIHKEVQLLLCFHKSLCTYSG